MIARAINNKQYDEARRLIEEGHDVNETCDDAGVALSSAICSGRLDLFRLLVHKNADVNARGYQRWTPMHYAATCSARMCWLLIKHGADMNAVTDLRDVPLRIACCWRLPFIVCLLLEYGATPVGDPMCRRALEVLHVKTQLRHRLPRELVAVVFDFFAYT